MQSAKLTRNLLVAGVIVLLALGIAWANKWNEQRKRSLSPRCATTARQLLAQALQYYGQAKQDSNPMYELMHVNFALAYVEAARSIATDEQLMTLVGYDVLTLYQVLLDAQKASMESLATHCVAAQSAPAAPPAPTRPAPPSGPQPVSAGMF